MELYVEMLKGLLEKKTVQVTFPQLQFDPREMLNCQSYQILQKIVEIIKDDTLSDAECYEQIERIVQILERNGVDTGSRHDFG